MLQGKTSSVFTLSLLLTLAAPVGLPAAFFTQLASAQSSPTSFSLPASVPSGTAVRIDGSDSMAVINQALKQKFEAQYGGTRVNLATGGTDAALKAVLDGRIDLAAVGRPLTQAEKAQGLVEVPITREKIAIIVGPENPFRGNLSFEQFARLFRGEITDWAQLGGASGRIRFIDRPDSSDTRQAFRNYKVFQVAPFRTGSNATQVSQDSTATAIAALGRDGISYAIASQVLDQPNVRIISMHGTLPDDPRYPFSQPRGYVYKGTPSPAVQSFLGFVTAPIGVATIAQAKAAEAQAVAAGTGTAPATTGGTGADAAGTPTGTTPAGGTTGASAPGAMASPAAGATGATSGATGATGAAATAISPTPAATASPDAAAPVTGAAGTTGTAGTAGTTGTAGTIGTAGTAGTTATNPAGTDGATNPTENRSGAGWLPWLLLPLAAIGGFLLWRSRRGSTSEAAPTASTPSAPVVPSATSGTGTTLAQRTGSVVTADRLELMSNSAAASRSVDVPSTPEPTVSETSLPNRAIPPASAIPPVVEPPEVAAPLPPAEADIAQPTEAETTAIDPETVEEIPSAAIDPGIPSAAIDPTLLGGAALAAGTGALFGLSELRDRSEIAEPAADAIAAEPPAIELPAESPIAESIPEFTPESTATETPAIEPPVIEPPVVLPPANADLTSGAAISETVSEPDAAIDANLSTAGLQEPVLPLVPEALISDGAIVPEETVAVPLTEEPAVAPEPEPTETTIESVDESVESADLASPEPDASLGGMLPLAAMAAGAGLFAASRGASEETPDLSPSEEIASEEIASGETASGELAAADLESQELPAALPVALDGAIVPPPPPMSSAQFDDQVAIEAARFDVGSDLSIEELAAVDANLPDLPGGYGESQIVLLPRDPQWAYAYWDVPAEQKQAARQQGGTRFALRFYDVTNIDSNRQNPHSLQQYECDEMARNWYIPVPLSDRDYIAEVGYTAEDGGWLLLARSLPIRIPPVYPSDWSSEEFLTIDWQSDLRDRTFLELTPPGERKTFSNPIYDRIFGLSEAAEAQRVAGSLYSSMQPVPSQAVSSFASGAGLAARTESGVGMSGIGMYSMSGIGLSGVGLSGVGMTALTESGIGMVSGVGMYSMSGVGMMSGVGLAGMPFSGVGLSGAELSGAGIYSMSGLSGIGLSGIGMYSMSGIGMSGVGFFASMPPMRPRRFWLIADAELIVYGATEPDATVTIAGRPVQLNPDGTFRFQMSFQDGVIDFPILAVAADGEQTRSIHLNFERQTPGRNTNTKEDAKDEWFPG